MMITHPAYTQQYESIPETPFRFSVGDRVAIVEKITWHGWVEPMDVYVGRSGLIVNRDRYYCYGNYYQLSVSCWNFPEGSLELMDPVAPLLPGHGYGNVHISQELPP